MIYRLKDFFDNTGKTTRVALLLIYDIMAVCLAEFMALFTRFEFSFQGVNNVYLELAGRYTLINILTTLIIYALFKLYSSLWRYASVREMLNVVAACMVSSFVQSFGMHMLRITMPRSYYILYLFFLLAFTAFSRFFYRGVRVARRSFLMERSRNVIPTMIIGATRTPR